MAVSVFSVSPTSGVTTTSGIDTGRHGWKNVYLEVPTMASGSLYVKVSSDGTTYRNLVLPQVNTGTVHTDLTINSSVTNRMVPIPAGFRYYQIRNTSGTTDVVTTYKIICSD